jgi:hypothetical protein
VVFECGDICTPSALLLAGALKFFSLKKRMSLKEPKQPPEVPRRLRLHLHQIVGLSLIALIPILAMFRVFGDGMKFAKASSASLQTEVEYPSKFKLKQSKVLRVKVTNVSTQTLDTTTVSIDTAYLSRFRDVSVIPGPAEAYIIEFLQLKPGEKREVLAEIEGKDYGEQKGIVTIATKQDTIRQPISSYIFW